MPEALNPYESPKAPLPDAPPARRRPVLVWVIVVFMAFGIVSGLVSTVAVLLGQPLGGEAARPFVQHLTAFDHLMTLVSLGLSTLGTIDLFRLKRRALPLLALVLALGIATFGFNLLLRPAYRAPFESFGYWGLFLGWGINVLILLYVWRLHAKGTLAP